MSNLRWSKEMIPVIWREKAHIEDGGTLTLNIKEIEWLTPSIALKRYAAGRRCTESDAKLYLQMLIISKLIIVSADRISGEALFPSETIMIDGHRLLLHFNDFSWSVLPAVFWQQGIFQSRCRDARGAFTHRNWMDVRLSAADITQALLGYQADDVGIQEEASHLVGTVHLPEKAIAKGRRARVDQIKGWLSKTYPDADHPRVAGAVTHAAKAHFALIGLSVTRERVEQAVESLGWKREHGRRKSPDA